MAPELRIRINADASDFKKEVKGLGNEAQKAFSTINQAGAVAMGIFGEKMFSGAISGIKDLTAGIVDAVSQMQNLEKSVQSITAAELVKASNGTLEYADAIGEATENAKALMAEIRDLAIVSPYGYQAVADVFKANANMGQSTKIAMKTTKAIMNLSAGLGLTSQQMAGLGNALAQTSATGVINKADIRQFANNGFGLDKMNAVFKQLSENTGIAIEDYDAFNKAVEAGKISTDEFFVALEEYSQKNYGGSAEEMAKTIEGLKSTMDDIGFFAKSDLFKPLGDELAAGIAPIVGWISDELGAGAFEELGLSIADWAKPLTDSLQNIGTEFESGAIKKAAENLIGYFTGSKDDLNEVADTLRRIGGTEFALEGVDKLETLKKGFDWLVKHKDEIIGALKNIGIALLALMAFKTLSSIINSLANPLTLIIGLAAFFGAAWEMNLFDIQGKWESLKTVVENAIDSIRTKMSEWGLDSEALSGKWENMKTAFEPVKQLFEETFNETKQGVIDNFKKSIDDLKEDFDSQTWKNFGNTLLEIGKVLAGILLVLADMALGSVDDVVRSIGDGLTNVLNIGQKLAETISNLWELIKAVATGDWDTAKVKLENFGTSLDSLGQAIIDSVKDGVQNAIDLLVNMFWDAYIAIAHFVPGLSEDNARAGKQRYNDQREAERNGVVYVDPTPFIQFNNDFWSSIEKGFDGSIREFINDYEEKNGQVSLELLEYLKDNYGNTDPHYAGLDDLIFQRFTDPIIALAEEMNIPFMEAAQQLGLSAEDMQKAEAIRAQQYEREFELSSENLAYQSRYLDMGLRQDWLRQNPAVSEESQRAMFDYAYNGIYAPVAEVAETIESTAQTVEEAVGQTAEEVGNAVDDAKETVAGAADAVEGSSSAWTGTGDNVNDYMATYFSGDLFADAVSDIADELYDATDDLAEEVVTAVESAIEDVVTETETAIETAAEDVAKEASSSLQTETERHFNVMDRIDEIFGGENGLTNFLLGYQTAEEMTEPEIFDWQASYEAFLAMFEETGNEFSGSASELAAAFADGRQMWSAIDRDIDNLLLSKFGMSDSETNIDDITEWQLKCLKIIEGEIDAGRYTLETAQEALMNAVDGLPLADATKSLIKENLVDNQATTLQDIGNFVGELFEEISRAQSESLDNAQLFQQYGDYLSGISEAITNGEMTNPEAIGKRVLFAMEHMNLPSKYIDSIQSLFDMDGITASEMQTVIGEILSGLSEAGLYVGQKIDENGDAIDSDLKANSTATADKLDVNTRLAYGDAVRQNYMSVNADGSINYDWAGLKEFAYANGLQTFTSDELFDYLFGTSFNSGDAGFNSPEVQEKQAEWYNSMLEAAKVAEVEVEIPETLAEAVMDAIKPVIPGGGTGEGENGETGFSLWSLIFGDMDTESIEGLAEVLSPDLFQALQSLITTTIDDDIIESWGEFSTELERAATALQTMMVALTGGTDGELGTDEAGDAMAEGLRKLGDAAVEITPSIQNQLNPQLDVMEQHFSQILSFMTKIIDIWTAGSWKKAVESFVALSGPAIDTCREFATQAGNAATKYEDWASAIERVIAGLKRLSEMTGSKGKSSGSSSSNPPLLAAGGTRNFRYGTAIVGEHGPELVTTGSTALNVFSNSMLMDEIAHTRHALNLLSNSAEFIAYDRLVGNSGGSTTNDNSQNFTNNFGTIIGEDGIREFIDEEMRRTWRREMRLAN